MFADTQWWVANAIPSDQWALPARRLRRELAGVTVVTTDEVLVEFLGYVAAYGASLRREAAKVLREALQDPGVRVFPQTRESMLHGLDLFESRPDKGYSLVDCVSMNVMTALKITEVLTGDHHFEQEGFVALMRGR